jgi:hypothetical protein
MDQSTPASDSDDKASTPNAKGFAQIALGAAAGAFVASRMNRGALLLTAGLVYSLWKKGLGAADVASQSMETPTCAPVPNEPWMEPLHPAEAIPGLAKLAQESSTEEPEAQGSAPAPAQIIPAIEPATSPPHIAPFLLFPVTQELSPQTDPEIRATAEALSPKFDPEPVQEAQEESMDPAPESQESNAWEELRAALTPSYPTAPARTDLDRGADDEAELETQDSKKAQEEPPHLIPSSEVVTFIEPPTLLESPPMIDLAMCQPSSPLIHTPIAVGMEIPDEIHLPDLDEESTTASEDFLLDQPMPSEPSGIAQPPLKPFTVIIPRQDIKFTSAITPPAPLPDEAAPSLLSAPVVIPRDVQAKKSFFDWLRG